MKSYPVLISYQTIKKCLNGNFWKRYLEMFGRNTPPKHQEKLTAPIYEAPSGTRGHCFIDLLGSKPFQGQYINIYKNISWLLL